MERGTVQLKYSQSNPPPSDTPHTTTQTPQSRSSTSAPHNHHPLALPLTHELHLVDLNLSYQLLHQGYQPLDSSLQFTYPLFQAAAICYQPIVPLFKFTYPIFRIGGMPPCSRETQSWRRRDRDGPARTDASIPCTCYGVFVLQFRLRVRAVIREFVLTQPV